MGHHVVDALLAEYGTSRPGVHRDRGPGRSARPRDELLHIDIKGPFWPQRLRASIRKVPTVRRVDDHSRFIIGLRVLPSPSTQPNSTGLGDCFELCGMPHEVMSDIQTGSRDSAAHAIGR